jgi:hypothetical protein
MDRLRAIGMGACVVSDCPRECGDSRLLFGFGPTLFSIPAFSTFEKVSPPGVEPLLSPSIEPIEQDFKKRFVLSPIFISISHGILLP